MSRMSNGHGSLCQVPETGKADLPEDAEAQLSLKG